MRCDLPALTGAPLRSSSVDRRRRTGQATTRQHQNGIGGAVASSGGGSRQQSARRHPDRKKEIGRGRRGHDPARRSAATRQGIKSTIAPDRNLERAHVRRPPSCCRDQAVVDLDPVAPPATPAAPPTGSASRAREMRKHGYPGPLCDANSMRCDLPALTGAPLRSSSVDRRRRTGQATTRQHQNGMAAPYCIIRRGGRDTSSCCAATQISKKKIGRGRRGHHPARRSAATRQGIKSTIAPDRNLERAHVRRPPSCCRDQAVVDLDPVAPPATPAAPPTGSASRAREMRKHGYPGPLCDANSMRCDLPALTGAPLRSSSVDRRRRTGQATTRQHQNGIGGAVLHHPARRSAATRQGIKSTIAPDRNLERAHVRRPPSCCRDQAVVDLDPVAPPATPAAPPTGSASRAREMRKHGYPGPLCDANSMRCDLPALTGAPLRSSSVDRRRRTGQATTRQHQNGIGGAVLHHPARRSAATRQGIKSTIAPDRNLERAHVRRPPSCCRDQAVVDLDPVAPPATPAAPPTGSASRAREMRKHGYPGPLCDANSMRCDLPALTGAPLRSSSVDRRRRTGQATTRQHQNGIGGAVLHHPARRSAATRQGIKSTIAPDRNLERAHVRRPPSCCRDQAVVDLDP